MDEVIEVCGFFLSISIIDFGGSHSLTAVIDKIIRLVNVDYIESF